MLHLEAHWLWRLECLKRFKAFTVGQTMSQAAQETQPKFWQPPSPVVASGLLVRNAVSSMAEACPRCATEFLLGSRFCHTCGGRRPEVVRADAAALAGVWRQMLVRVRSVEGFSWRNIELPSWLHYLHFHEIQGWVGLSTAALIAFIAGVGCVAGALLVGLITPKTFEDWQAIQFYRAEWLLAATAAFVAGILLKRPSDRGTKN
jgi:hypothetical protein